MSLRVVSTKLTEEEHTRLLDLCIRNGCTPSALVKQAIQEKIEMESQTEASNKISKGRSLKELLKSIDSKHGK